MNWNNACESDKFNREALLILFEGYENLFNLLLDPDYPKLNYPASRINRYCRGLSSGEKLLINIGLDIWSGEGKIHFNDLYQILSDENFKRIIRVLLYLRPQSNEISF